MSSVENSCASPLTHVQVQRLNTHRIVFGHQSVGDNILDGVREVVAADSRLKLNMSCSFFPDATPGPAFTEFHIGRNRDPESKNKAFVEALRNGFGALGGIAFFKYCYIDFGPKTNVNQVFRGYRKLMAEVQASYPSLVLVHVTVPLTASEKANTSREKVRTFLRRALGREPNIKRNSFNRKLRKAYGRTHMLFDLADAESTGADGSRCGYRRGATRVSTLAPEWTDDGGHLNAVARRRFAEQLLGFLGDL